jgi:hypothetical protein
MAMTESDTASAKAGNDILETHETRQGRRKKFPAVLNDLIQMRRLGVFGWTATHIFGKRRGIFWVIAVLGAIVVALD